MVQVSIYKDKSSNYSLTLTTAKGIVDLKITKEDAENIIEQLGIEISLIPF